MSNTPKSRLAKPQKLPIIFLGVCQNTALNVDIILHPVQHRADMLEKSVHQLGIIIYRNTQSLQNARSQLLGHLPGQIQIFPLLHAAALHLPMFLKPHIRRNEIFIQIINLLLRNLPTSSKHCQKPPGIRKLNRLCIQSMLFSRRNKALPSYS